MEKILLIGTGPMALAYSTVLDAQKINYSVIGRGIESARKFEEQSGKIPSIGGVKKYLDENSISENTFAIIATGTESLMSILLLLIEAKVKRILIEKPAAISIEELLKNEHIILNYKENIFVAYNRRFYSSVSEAERIIEEDGGLKSIHFEFTEWAHKIEPLHKSDGVKENWFFANSTHVVDLAFYFAGKPIDWKAFSKPGKLNWHSKTNFVGAGVTEKGILFSYISNWESAGRWGIELLTSERRIYLKPMESLSIQKKGSLEINKHVFDDTIDLDFKPGIYKQIDAFLTNHTLKLQSIETHIENSKNIYSKIID